MIKNSLMKFIDSCVGNIARKIEDEFRESDHPRDKGGKFTSKGNEGRGGGSGEEHDEVMSSVRNIMNRALSGNPRDPRMRKRAQKELRKAMSKESSSKPLNISVSAGGDTERLKEEAAEYGVKARIGSSSHGETSVKLSGAKEDIRRYLEEKFYGSEDDAREFSPEVYEKSEGSEEDDEGYMGLSKEELAEEEEYENARERARREKDDDRVTGPEDRDYMNEEDGKEYGSEGADEGDDSDEEIKAGKETDKIVEEFEGSGIDMYSAMADLGLDVHRIPESHLAGAFKEALFNSPRFRRKAKQYISEYRSIDPDEEEDWFK